MKVINRTQSPLALPFDIGLVEPGDSKTITAAQHEQLRENAICGRWIQTGIIAIDEGQSVDLDAEPSDEAEALVAELAEHGIKKTTRTNIEKLRELAEQARGE